MPLYEFHCKQCDHEFEELCSPSSINAVSCPKCKDSNVEKMMSAFAFSSKGSSSEIRSSKGSSCSSCKASSCKSCSK
ncbi:TPA: zinc ribbon domain-containing protein [bacterium]|nr:zinc ribbon domain-containing protein [bacterium]